MTSVFAALDPNVQQTPGKTSKIQLDDDDDDDDHSYMSPLDDGDSRRSFTLDEAQKMAKTPNTQQRRRRRSSARFLRLSGRFDDVEEDETGASAPENEQLGEMYQRAIRLHAENRINAGNSWNLNLIENLDKFLGDEPRSSENGRSTEVESRVNFTRASCSLDASVKIYSYRVDDVHLTSYKVLANLNRTDTDGKKGKRKENEDDEVGGSLTSLEGDRPASRRGPTETLETNTANINMNKLDSAFDIDPLFHKMSKTFDEGGAKGLLLANLGVGTDGCGIVFDSKVEDVDDETPQEADDLPREECVVDISNLASKLEGLLSGASVESLALVPQLASLRQDFAKLQAEGFVDDKIPPRKPTRYANSKEEDREAEVSIHREAIERSRASQVPFASPGSLDSRSHDAQEFDDGDDDHDYGDDTGFDNFLALDQNGGRYSSSSFTTGKIADDFIPGDAKSRKSTTVLLDALCDGDALFAGGDYEYLNSAALEKAMGGNIWAGSSHWRKSETIRGRKSKAPSRQDLPKRKREKKDRSFVEFSESQESVETLLKKPKQKKGGTDPLQLPKTRISKLTTDQNLLPLDAGIGVDQLSRLYLRPHAIIRRATSASKTVGFSDAVVFSSEDYDDGDKNSFGDHDHDGPGFQFVANEDGDFDEKDDFAVAELKGVRKVDKIEVGYATVAKKVDVKRLKRDLWHEIEEVVTKEDGKEKESHNKEKDKIEEDPPMKMVHKDEGVLTLSFKETVSDMESSQRQGDVTVPFYFICILHLANEKGLKLESSGLEDFIISQDVGAAPSFGTLPSGTTDSNVSASVASQRERRKKEATSYTEDSEDEE